VFHEPGVGRCSDAVGLAIWLVAVLALGLVGVTGCGELIGDVDVSRPPLRASSDAGPPPPSLSEPVATACEVGKSRCQGAVLQSCALDGSGWRSVERCASAALCLADPGERSRCIEPVCLPGVTCEGELLRECNADATAYEQLDVCSSAAHCDPSQGACQLAPCAVGEISCNGNVVQRCNDLSSGHDPLLSCATAALCGDLVLARCGADRVSCDMGGAACPVPACATGQLRCDGTRLESCNAGQNGWEFVDECPSAGICQLTLETPLALGCVEPRCEVGGTICSPEGAILACNVEQTEYSVLQAQCRSLDYCTPTGCEADPCTPGALSCNGSTLQVCQASADGTSISRLPVADCQTEPLCQATLTRGVITPQTCQAPSCAANEFRCAGRQMQVCNGGRTDLVNHELCATDGLCEAGIGLGACPTPCSGFECNGGSLLGCNQERTGKVLLENCGTAAECDSVNGRCSDPCVPGELRCNGTALEECQNPLVGWQRLQTCETGGLCGTSVAAGRRSCDARRCAPGEHRCDGQKLEVCNTALTGFDLVSTCNAGQICDAPNQQCDVCSPNDVDCNGDRFVRCSANGQQQTEQACGSGLCSSLGNVGCLRCPEAGAFRCDNQGSLFQCSANQAQENQLEVCRTPQLCRAELGRCLECDPSGSSRCEGAEVRTCSEQNVETTSQVCESAALCRPSGPSSVSCGSSACTVPFQCTVAGEVLACNQGRTGYEAQSPRVFCDNPSLCDASEGCRAPACAPAERRCAGQVVEICNDALTGFRAFQTCDAPAGLTCESGDAGTASCACTPNSHHCVVGRGLVECDGSGASLSDVTGDAECVGSARVSCNGAELLQNQCQSAAHCSAGSGESCAECVRDAECDDSAFCTGTESCDPTSQRCVSRGSPCAPGQVCSEALTGCVDCVAAGDCAVGQVCADNTCRDPTDGGT
jgi:hypothetical protein